MLSMGECVDLHGKGDALKSASLGRTQSYGHENRTEYYELKSLLL
jgi:hypothetical protein